MTVSVESSPRPLSGWGRTAPTTALVSRPVDVSSVWALFRAHPGGVIARGLGRSYGDAAQCTGGLTIDTAGLSHIGTLDELVGTIEVGGGVSLHDLMRRLIPAGWFVPVTPGNPLRDRRRCHRRGRARKEPPSRGQLRPARGGDDPRHAQRCDQRGARS